MIPPSSALGKSNRRLTDGSDEYSRVKLPNVVVNSTAGFQRIRYYGFLNKHSSLSIDRVRMLVWFYLGWCYVLAKYSVPEPPPKRPMRCTECGGTLHLVEITDHVGRVLYSHPLPYLDSG